MTESLEQEIRTLRSLFWSDRDPDGRGFAPLADAYRRAGEVRQALDLLADGLVRHPEFVPGHVVAAQLYVEQGLQAEGELAARRALELDPDNVNALKCLAAVLQESGRESEAGGVHARLTDLEPDPGTTTTPSPAAAEAASVGPSDEVMATVEDGSPEAIEADPWTGQPSDKEESGPRGSEESLFDLGDLAPDPAADLPESRVMAHYEPTEEPIELGDLSADAPMGQPEAVFDFGELAPDEPAEEALDIGAVAPDEPAEEAFDIGAMAPDEPAEEAFGIGAMAPDEPVEGEPAEPLYTRTLAELYVRQGFTDRAIDVFRQLLEDDPSDAALAMRLAELQAETTPPEPAPAMSEMESLVKPVVSEELADLGVAELEAPPEEEVETLARDLAEAGHRSHEVDSPFAWTEEEAQEENAAGPTIGEYFDGLLGWQQEDSS